MSSLGSVEKLLGRENYGSWSFAMKCLLIQEGVWKSVAGTANCGEENLSVVSERALAMIVLSVDKKNYSLIDKCNTAQEAWKILKVAFGDVDYLREADLLNKLCGVCLEECESVQDYIDQLLTTAQQLREIGFTVEDCWLVGLMLKGLPQKYKEIVVSMKSCGSRMSVDEVKLKIFQALHISEMHSCENIALTAVNVVSRNPQRVKSKVKCFECKEFGHYKSKCPVFREKKCKRKFKDEAFYANRSSKEADREWIIDSGSTIHLCHNKAMLTKLQMVKRKVKVADDTAISITAMGESSVSGISNLVPISKVSYAPDLAVNLLSVSQICQKGNKVVFTSRGCKIYNLKGQLFSTGRLEGGLYKLNQNKNEAFKAMNYTIISEAVGVPSKRMEQAVCPIEREDYQKNRLEAFSGGVKSATW